MEPHYHTASVWEPAAPEHPYMSSPGAVCYLGSYLSQEQGSHESPGFNFILASTSITVSLQSQLKPKPACLPDVLPWTQRFAADSGRGSQGFQDPSPAGLLGPTSCLQTRSHGRCWCDSCWLNYCLPSAGRLPQNCCCDPCSSPFNLEILYTRIPFFFPPLCLFNRKFHRIFLPP